MRNILVGSGQVLARMVRLSAIAFAFLGFTAWMRPHPQSVARPAPAEDPLSAWLLDHGWQEPQTAIEATTLPRMKRKPGPGPTPVASDHDPARGRTKEPDVGMVRDRAERLSVGSTGDGSRIAEGDAPAVMGRRILGDGRLGLTEGEPRR